MHVDQVMQNVPEDQRCPGHGKQKRGFAGLFGR